MYLVRRQIQEHGTGFHGLVSPYPSTDIPSVLDAHHQISQCNSRRYLRLSTIHQAVIQDTIVSDFLMLMFAPEDALVLGGQLSIQERAARFCLGLWDTLKIPGMISVLNGLAGFLSVKEESRGTTSSSKFSASLTKGMRHDISISNEGQKHNVTTPNRSRLDADMKYFDVSISPLYAGFPLRNIYAKPDPLFQRKSKPCVQVEGNYCNITRNHK